MRAARKRWLVVPFGIALGVLSPVHAGAQDLQEPVPVRPGPEYLVQGQEGFSGNLAPTQDPTPFLTEPFGWTFALLALALIVLMAVFSKWGKKSVIRRQQQLPS